MFKFINLIQFSMYFYVTLVTRTAVVANPRPTKNRRPFDYTTTSGHLCDQNILSRSSGQWSPVKCVGIDHASHDQTDTQGHTPLRARQRPDMGPIFTLNCIALHCHTFT